VAEFLKAVDPEGTRGIEQRLANYHAGEMPESEPPQFQQDQASAGTLSDSMDMDAATRTLLQAPAAASGSGAVAATTNSQMRTGTLVMAAGGGALATVLILIVGAFSAWWWFVGRAQPSVFDEPVVETQVKPVEPKVLQEPVSDSPKVEDEKRPAPQSGPAKKRSSQRVADGNAKQPPQVEGIEDYDIDEEEWEETLRGTGASVFDTPPVDRIGQPAAVTETPTASIRVPWYINSSPQGLELLVDGKFAGVTPKKLDLTEGEHLFLVRSADGRAAEETVEIRQNARPPSTMLILKR